MARYQKGKNYKQQTKEYRADNTRDMFRGQRDMKEKRMAGKKLMERKGVDRMRDLPKGVRPRFAERNEISFMGNAKDEGSQYYDEGRLKDITDKKNPFENIDRYTGAEYGRGSQRGRELLTTGDLQGLKNIGGHDKQKIIDFAENSDAQISGNAENLLDRWKTAIMEAEKETPNPGPVGTLPGIDEVNNIDVLQGDDGMSNIGDGTQSQINNNELDDGSAIAGPGGMAVGGSNQEIEGDTGDITIAGNNTFFEPIVSGNYSNDLTFNYGPGLADSGYRPFTGDVAGYQALGERNFDENSGLKYGAMVTDYFTKNASRPVDSQGLREEADGQPLKFFDLATQFDLANYGSAKNYANSGRFEMPGEPEDLSNKLEELKEFGLV